PPIRPRVADARAPREHREAQDADGREPARQHGSRGARLSGRAEPEQEGPERDGGQQPVMRPVREAPPAAVRPGGQRRADEREECADHVDQWVGDSLAVSAWKHIWLDEGFATYADGSGASARGSERLRSTSTRGPRSPPTTRSGP
ncbi:MAG: hypothetical protein H0V26_13355, partial [Solirubrobacterales bacterium]|nr:hypothetical protein [Solirubrobacterales bacterium]